MANQFNPGSGFGSPGQGFPNPTSPFSGGAGSAFGVSFPPGGFPPGGAPPGSPSGMFGISSPPGGMFGGGAGGGMRYPAGAGGVFGGVFGGGFPPGGVFGGGFPPGGFPPAGGPVRPDESGGYRAPGFSAQPFTPGLVTTGRPMNAPRGAPRAGGISALRSRRGGMR